LHVQFPRGLDKKNWWIRDSSTRGVWKQKLEIVPAEDQALRSSYFKKDILKEEIEKVNYCVRNTTKLLST